MKPLHFGSEAPSLRSLRKDSCLAQFGHERRKRPDARGRRLELPSAHDLDRNILVRGFWKLGTDNFREIGCVRDPRLVFPATSLATVLSASLSPFDQRAQFELQYFLGRKSGEQRRLLNGERQLAPAFHENRRTGGKDTEDRGNLGLQSLQAGQLKLGEVRPRSRILQRLDEQGSKNGAVALRARYRLAPVRMELVGFRGESFQDLLGADGRRRVVLLHQRPQLLVLGERAQFVGLADSRLFHWERRFSSPVAGD